MSKRSEIITLIQNMLTGNAGKTTRAQHEDYVFDEADSLLKNLYNTTVITDTNASTNVFTETDSDIDYILKVQKQGAYYTVKGTITNNKSTPIGSLTSLLTISNDEYTPSLGYSFNGFMTNDNSTIGMILLENGTNSKINLKDIMMPGETVRIDILITVGQ